MNNERFRFRAFLVQEHRLVDISSIDYETNDIWIGNEGHYDAYHLDEGVILMQCTGLRDSEGRLIWESDILKRFNEINPDYGFDICVVQWNQSRCYFELQGHEEYYGHICGNHANEGRYLVIGNIYEHSHLIEQNDPGQGSQASPSASVAASLCRDKSPRQEGE